MEHNDLRSFYVSKFCLNAGTRPHLTLFGFLQTTAVYLKRVSKAGYVKSEEWGALQCREATLTTGIVVDTVQRSV